MCPQQTGKDVPGTSALVPGGLHCAPLVRGLKIFSNTRGIDAVLEDFQTRSQSSMSSFHFMTSSLSPLLFSKSAVHSQLSSQVSPDS